MADKKQQSKEQLKQRLKASQRNKISAKSEKAQRAAGRVTVAMLSEARENKAQNYNQLLTKYKTQESFTKFLEKERTSKSKEALAREKKRTGRK